MQPLFKSALILDYSMCMIWTFKKKRKKKKTSSEVFCSQFCGLEASRGHRHPLPPATSFKMRLRPRLKRQLPEVNPFRKRHESRMTWRTGATPGLCKY